jgi:hypothetical protein
METNNSWGLAWGIPDSASAFPDDRGGIMARAALRHELCVIAAQRIIGMKNRMALGTGNCLVAGTVFFKPLVI